MWERHRTTRGGKITGEVDLREPERWVQCELGLSMGGTKDLRLGSGDSSSKFLMDIPGVSFSSVLF